VGGARTALAVVPFVALPLKVMRAERALTERLSSQSAGDRCALVAEAEQWLLASARAEERGRSWVKHTAVVSLNVVAGLVLGLGFDRWPQAALTASTGILVGEIMILTQPMHSVEALRRYREGHLGNESALASRQDWVIAPAMSGGGRFGLMVATRF
jgi:Tfp pilus assembly protein PilN